MHRWLILVAGLILAFSSSAAEWVHSGSGSEALPLIRVTNPGREPRTLRVESVLRDTEGLAVATAAMTREAAPGESVTLAPFPEVASVSGEIRLLESTVTGEGDDPVVLSTVVGTPRPVRAAGLVGMNVHLGRYTPAVRWRLMRLLRDAGVVHVRVDAGFGIASNPEEVSRALAALREEVLGLEAFGLRPLILLGYYPPEFYDSPRKSQLACEWAYAMAAGLRGRADFHYGNETNSGWAGFGAAADLAVVNKAFALGTLAADPSAKRGSFGIAEGLADYVKEFCRTDADSYLDALAVHPYCGTPEAGVAKSAAAKALLRSRNRNCEVWATEIGFQVDDGPGKLNALTRELTGIAGFSLEHQRQLLPRLFLLAAQQGIDRVYWYDFFGGNDPETFWLVDENERPRPAYFALKECARRLNGATAVDGTSLSSLIQKQLFRNADGSLFLACWALQSGVTADFLLPPGVTLRDDCGNELPLPADRRLTLGHGVVYVDGFDPAEVPSILERGVLLSSLDQTTFNRPAHRFTVKPGETFEVPLAAFNSLDRAVTLSPRLERGVPGWRITLPPDFAVDAKAGNTRPVKVKVPADAVPGVEQRLVFGGRLDGGVREVLPFEVRVEVTGDFPYRAIRAAAARGDAPQWSSFHEDRAGTGNPWLEAAPGIALPDGRLDEWSAAEFYPIDQKFQWILRDPGVPDSADWSGRVAFRWDAKNLYVAFLIDDEDLSCRDFLSRDWRDSDNLRVMLSAVADPARRPKQITETDLLTILTPTGMTGSEPPMVSVAALGGLSRPGAEQRIQTAAQLWHGGYALEAVIPFSLIGFTPSSGAVLGLNVMADDVDDGYRQHVAMTRYENQNYWNSPAATGNLRLR